MDDGHARGRLSRVLAAAGITGGSWAIRLESYSADVWKVGDYVVRIGWQGDVGRYAREAALAGELPPELGYPEVVTAGQEAGLAWIVSRHIHGHRLDQVWDTLDIRGRRRAVGRVADILQGLHSWRPPEPVSTMLRDHTVDTATDAPALVGMDICPVPVDRAMALAEHARKLPHVNDAHIEDTMARLQQLTRSDPYRDQRPSTVVHGDLHFANLLWNDGSIVAALDFEWARIGSADQDLEPLLRSVDWDHVDDPGLVSCADMTQVLGWLSADYPALFAATNLVDRLWLYQLAYTVRELFTWPITGPPQELAPDHPLNRLPRFVASADHIRSILTAAAVG